MTVVKSFDPVWNHLHQARMPQDTWPTDDMIRQVARNYFGRADRRTVRVLDMGCGSGSMAWFLARAGFDVYAVDGAGQAVEHCRQRLHRENLQAHVQTADFLALPFEDNFFDLVVEIHAFMCAAVDLTRAFVGEAYRVLKPGGMFFSRTPAEDCWGVGCGVRVGKNCWSEATEGPFAGMGLVRFMRREDAYDLYAPFTVEAVEKSSTTLDNGAHTLSSYIVICRKNRE